MPFTHKDGHTTQTMWQLSFSGLTEAEGITLRTSEKDDVLAQAVERTNGWLPFVQGMISSTPLEEVWSTPLYDRALNPLKQRTR